MFLLLQPTQIRFGKLFVLARQSIGAFVAGAMENRSRSAGAARQEKLATNAAAKTGNAFMARIY
jgi:hypothetical protein